MNKIAKINYDVAKYSQNLKSSLLCSDHTGQLSTLLQSVQMNISPMFGDIQRFDF